MSILPVKVAVGGLAGYSLSYTNFGTISNVYVSGNITASGSGAYI